MALAQTYDWFQHWGPPSGIFPTEFPSTPRFHQQTHQSHIQARPQGPYNGYSYSESPQAYSEVGRSKYRGSSSTSQSVRTPHSHYRTELGLVGDDTIDYNQGQNGIFGSWQSPAIGLQEQKYETRNPYRQSPVTRLLPTLLAVGMLNGGNGERGDQPPPPDPDRDLGGPAPLRLLYQWKLVDFAYKNNRARQVAIDSKQFIPINTLPLGIEAWRDRVFVTFPRWKNGVPCTLATVPRTPKSHDDTSPKMRPYPNWDYHQPKSDCSGLTSVFRINADKCGRLWVLDSGQVEALNIPKQVCPPQIFVFNLTTDALIARYRIPDEHVRQNSLFSNIVTDIRDDKCDDVHVYITDVWRFAILVFRMQDQKFWRFNSHLFYPDPLASDYTVRDINFQWSDGVFGIALTPLDQQGDRTLFFHAMSSFREFMMPASVLRNSTAANDTALLAKVIRLAGESRGLGGQSSAEAIDRNGIMYFNLVTRDSIGCWDIRKPYKRSTMGVVATDHEQLIFPNDLKVDSEVKQSVWVLSNRLPVFLYRQLDPNDVNFRILREFVDDAITGTICDPRQQFLGPPRYEPECF